MVQLRVPHTHHIPRYITAMYINGALQKFVKIASRAPFIDEYLCFHYVFHPGNISE